MKKELAVVTMVYDDTDYLRIWLKYWRAQLAEDQLYVLVHGGNAALEKMAEGTNVVIVPRPDPYPEMEEDRWKMLSEFVNGLLETHRVAVYTDVDEILITDPKSPVSIVQRLAQAKAPVSHAVGVEVLHRGDLEPKLQADQPVLSQRGYFRLTSLHSKPCIVTAPVRWGRGGHFHDRKGMRFLSGVYSVHLRFYDEEVFLERAARRRKTTKAPEGLDQNANRLWRTSDAAAVALLEELRQLPVRPFGWRAVLALKYRMWRRSWRHPDEKGLYRYRLFTPEEAHRVPKRFSQVF